jgi:hypothetical protein
MAARPTFAEEIHASEIKSLRRFVYDNFGGAPSNPPILVQRDDLARRPYWRVLGSAVVMMRREASGWDNGLRQYVLGYFDTDYDEVMRKLDILRSRLMATSSIPYRVYDAAWFSPRLFTPVDEDAVFEPGLYTVSCSALIVQPDGELAETLPSDPVEVTLAEETQLLARVPTWPSWAPLATKVRVYVGVGDEARQLQAEVDAVTAGWTPVPLTGLVEDGDLEPTSSVVWIGRLNVDQVSVSAFESAEKDGEFDGIATVYLARELPTADLAGWGVYADEQVTVFPPGSP